MIRKAAHILATFGCIAAGLLYAGIGTVAILSFLKIKDGGTDESSLLEYLNHYILGKILVWLILLGSVSYVFWRFYEAWTDPYNYGSSFKGKVIRVMIALSTLADILIIYSSLQAILDIGSVSETGDPSDLHAQIRKILQHSYGLPLLVSAGILIIFTAIGQFIYGITKGYSERIDLTHLRKTGKIVVHSIAIYGYFSRGVILAIIGFFMAKAAISHHSEYAVNTDKAFDFIGDHIGHFYFIFIAIGTICYGAFMMKLGARYDSNKMEDH